MKWVSSAVFALFCCGCYTTRTYTRGKPVRASGPVYESHQVFSVGGLAPVSKPSGIRCSRGLSSVESSLSATDWLLTAFLSVAGAAISMHMCPVFSSSGKRAACFAGVGAGPAFMISVRALSGTGATATQARAQQRVTHRQGQARQCLTVRR